MEKQNLPKWFKGSEYTKGDKVRNPFSNEEYELNSIELSMYDYIIGTQLVMEMSPQTITAEQTEDFQKALDWFKENNLKAFQVLLD
jgi:hypothetical protein